MAIMKYPSVLTVISLALVYTTTQAATVRVIARTNAWIPTVAHKAAMKDTLSRTTAKSMPQIVNGGSLNAVVRQDEDEYSDYEGMGGDEFDDGDYSDDMGYGNDEEEPELEGEDSGEWVDELEPDAEEEPFAEEEPVVKEEPAPAPAAPAAAVLPKLHMEYTSDFPKSCSCKLGKGLHNGVCWEFSSPGSNACSSRKCKPSYLCVVGTSTGLTCFRKKITEAIKSNGDGTCTRKATDSYGYLPYSA